MPRAPAKGLWRAPHLPLFLMAAVWAALVPLVWLFPVLSDDPVRWHRQELILGFAGAAMGGYLLTALPHWLRQAGDAAPGWVPGKRAVQALVLAWIAGRIAAAQPGDGPLVLMGIEAYPVGLALCLLIPGLSARLWRRLPIALAPVGLLAVGVGLRQDGDGLTAALAMALIVALVGGRIVPAFLASRAGHAAPPQRGDLPVTAHLADLILGLALVGRAAGLGDGVVGGLLLATAVGQVARMGRWPLCEVLAGGQGDLLLLVVAWLWLPGGLILTGSGLILPGALAGIPLQTGLHALTMGFLGGMILAVMARAYMRRAPGVLRVGAALGLAFALVMLSTLSRLALFAMPGALSVPALLWCLGWAIFTGCALRSMAVPVPHPVLSAAQGKQIGRAHASDAIVDAIRALRADGIGMDRIARQLRCGKGLSQRGNPPHG